MDAQHKEQLIGRFREYLDGVSEYDDAPRADGEIDLFTLFTELAALKNEVRLESRQFRQALDHSRELIDGLRENNQRLGNELAGRRQAEAEVCRSAERPLLLEILELRDRMEAGLEGLRRYRPGLLGRRRTQRFLSGLGAGMEISLRRVDGLLARHRVEALESVGRPMDPDTMRVAGIEFQNEREDGLVLTEVRKGFLRAGEVLRLAEVIVNKRASKA